MSESVHLHPKDCLPPHDEGKLPDIKLSSGDLWFLAVVVAGILVLWTILG